MAAAYFFTGDYHYMYTSNVNTMLDNLGLETFEKRIHAKCMPSSSESLRQITQT